MPALVYRIVYRLSWEKINPECVLKGRLAYDILRNIRSHAMKTAHVCFLWHMHQPYYTDPVAGTASMPWVRFHAIKAYYDMAFLIERFPAVHATFNFTPSLLLQLIECASGVVVDLFYEHARRPAAELTDTERAFIIRHFFAANWATMVRPYPRYHELLVKRGTDVGRQALDRLAKQFTTQELLDLQVWHNLAWFGYGAIARHPRLRMLREKDQGFTEGEKHEVLAIQREVMSKIIPFYRRLTEAGQIELTTTPFYHPILPLVIDTEFATRARPEISLPSRFHAPDDAQEQLRTAVALHTDLFGQPPRGLWPSEGSVCPEMIPMLRKIGLRWMATDEGVLARSLEQWNRPASLYRAYAVGQAGQDVHMVFRDREISDAFGFVYSKSTPESAVEDVLRRVNDIIHGAPGDHLVIPIILDGENPWEHYHDGGERFLGGLYSHLTKGTLNAGNQIHMSAETISRSLEQHPPEAKLAGLHTGSWINTDFKIWIGHPEDNRAWEMLRETRARLADLSQNLPPEQARGAWQELYAAEGSDWFWWYGDDFETDFKAEFDRLFRTHLRNVFIRAGAPVPTFLDEPVMTTGLDPHQVKLPVTLSTPTIDGLVTSFFEWRGAGSIDPSPPLGAMWKANRLFSYLGFGYSLEALFLRLDPEPSVVPTPGGA